MPLVTLTTAGTAYPLATRPSRPSINPTAQWAATIDIEIISVGGTSILTTPSTAIVCLGSQGPLGQSSAVTTSAYDLKLDGTTNTSDTLGIGAECNDIDLSSTYLVSNTNTVVVSYNPRQV